MTAALAEAVATIDAAVALSAAVAEVRLAPGALAAAPVLLDRHFGARAACLVADENTWRAAGAAVEAHLAGAGVATRRVILPAAPRPKPTVERARAVAAALAEDGATPVAVGSGVLNDLVKHAAFGLGRPYLCVATAASMDGYASAGAPLSERGFKKTIPCRPARAVLADLDVLAAAPRAMAGWGYGDLAGKAPAGGDWLVADALGIEPVDAVAWPMVQDNLAGWLDGAEGVRAGEPGALARLFAGLTLTGLAMELHGSSRPASGADHQIAHVWEMEDLTVAGERAAHGACVAIGCLAALALYDWLLERDLGRLDAARIVAEAPPLGEKAAAIADFFPDPAVAERAVAETAAKHLEPAAHRARLRAIAAAWPGLRDRLRARLPRAAAMRARLAAAGAPTRAAEIGVDARRLRRTIVASRFIRSRYTVLDLLDETALLDPALDALFADPAFGPTDRERPA
jgi:glycerol-1-phosphate dehydrogenase [NAD(P)+]